MSQMVSPAMDVSGWRTEDKLAEAMRRSEPYMPAELWGQVQAFLQPESLAIMAGVTAAWAISHFFGVGEIADGVLLVAGGALLGLSAIDVGNEALAFALGARSARTYNDLDEAGKHFAAAMVRGGITVLSALFFIKRPATFREPVFKPVVVPRAAPRIGRLFYEPTTSFGAIRSRPGFYTRGITDMFGNITLNITLAAEDVASTLLHEKVHQFLTPKFYFLRNVRIKIAMEGYSRSYLLRYLEEALAQSYALVRTQGVTGIIEGISFPVKNGYVTVAKMASELHGICLGTVLAGGTTYRVFYNLRHRHDPGQHRRR